MCHLAALAGRGRGATAKFDIQCDQISEIERGVKVTSI
jgi:hypothetical protein